MPKNGRSAPARPASVGRHPVAQQHAHQPPADDLDADRGLVDLVPLHPPHDGERPGVAFLEREDLAQLRGRLLGRRGQPTSGLAAVFHLPHDPANPARDGFGPGARADHLGDFVVARRHAGGTGGIGQALDFGDGPHERRQTDDHADLGIRLEARGAGRCGRSRPGRRAKRAASAAGAARAAADRPGRGVSSSRSGSQRMRSTICV